MSSETEKVWFITGCSKGFGRELTQELLESTSANIAVTARKPNDLKEKLKKYAHRVLVLKLDVTEKNDIETAVGEAYKHFKRIDVLVNNAGYGLAGALEECTLDEIRAQFETNVFGLMAVTKEVLPIMRAQKQGHIINISSVAGRVAHPGLGIYNSTKFAVEGFSESLAQDVSNFGIKVTLIEPGPFRTDFAGNSLHLPPAHPDYENSKASEIRKYMDNMNTKQPGDPRKAAKIIIQITDTENPPLRLPLGKIALERIAAKFQSERSEFERYKNLAQLADFDSDDF